MFGKTAELGLCPFQPAAQFQISAIFLRQEIGNWPFNNAVAMIGQPHVVDDFGLQQADGVTGN